MKIYVNGRYYGKDEAAVSVFDHGLLYGDGIFEGIRIYNGKAFMLKDHIDRFFDSARYIMLDLPHTKDELADLVLENIGINGKDSAGESGYIRLVATRGTGDLGIDPGKCEKASLIIITSDISIYPQEYYKKGIAVVTASTRRSRGDQLSPQGKTLNYLNNILAKIEARQKGVQEALMLNSDGHVAECTVDNVFIVKNGEIYTPPVYQGSLDGITRRVVMTVASDSGLPISERVITLFDAYSADECFITGSAVELVPVIEIDGRTIGDGRPGKVTETLSTNFKKFVDKGEGI